MNFVLDERERRSIRADLESTHEEVRRLAVERAGAMPVEEALPTLVGCLGDESWRVRKAAVERLGAAPERARIARALVEALADGENSGRRNAALEALICCGAEAVPVVIEASASDDADVRKQAVDALAGIGDPRSGERLSQLLRDPDPNVRGASADAIGLLAAPGLAPVLLDAAHADMERLVRLSALRALARLEVSVEPRELTALVHDPHLRAAAFEVLGNTESPEALALLLKGLESSSRSAREAAMAALLRNVGRASPEEVDARVSAIREAARALPNLLESAQERLAQAALPQRLMLIQFLGLLGHRGSVVPILEAGRDEALSGVVSETLARFGNVAENALVEAWPGLDPELQLLAAGVLGRTPGTEAQPRLEEALRHGDPVLRAAAARALGQRGCVATLERLVERLDTAAAEEGAEGLAEIAALSDAIVALAREDAPGVDRSLGRLVAGLTGTREGYRCAAARILGRLGRVADQEALGLLLSDPSPSVRRAAVEGLVALDEERAAEPLRLALADEAPEVRIAAAAALATRCDPDAFPHLSALVRDPDPSVRAAALRAAGQRLGAGAHEDERPQVLALFERAREDEGPVAMALAEALTRAGGEEAARLATTLLGGAEPEVVRAAVTCVGRHGDGESLERLLPLVAHEAWSVRVQAIRCLAERGVERAIPPILRRLDFEQDPFVREAILGALRRLEG